MTNNMAEQEIPKHRKKRLSGKSKVKRKSKHKHEYVDCLILEKDGLKHPYKATYCKICGKIGELRVVTGDAGNGYVRMLHPEEVFERYKNLELIRVDSIFQKYI